MAIARGDLVRIKRPESYWYNEIGKVASVDKTEPLPRYPYTVRFEKINYNAITGVDGGAAANNFAADELEQV